MHIGDRVIRPLIWRIALSGVGLIFVAIALGVLFDQSSDVASQIGAGIFTAAFSAFVIIAMRMGVSREESGITIHGLGRATHIAAPARASLSREDTWWGGSYCVPVITPEGAGEADTDEDSVELLPLALYAVTTRGRRKAERMVKVLNSWLGYDGVGRAS